ncbi:STAS domain-containing protein [Mangrovihabitans endophyticus]|uniref:Anti-sigma factor antagonist n=1 Tax=Mangrovihabitans endophyticus TaxID=1751298 RepID=A0A8J3FTE1_9ACTN|nr:STAS domain-containing protein [Mangrovihabitans endophyticus]GGL19564.1 hypothetical protein GCM10012284_62650 [Mangrovihabitans endophyticus]
METPGLVVLTPAGELDMADRDGLERAVVGAVRSAGVQHVVLDLADVTFIDSEVLAAVIAGRNAAVAAGVRFCLANAHGMVRRVLEVTGLLEVLGS